MPVPKALAIGVYTFALFMILIGTAFGGTFVGSQQGVPNDKLPTGGSPCGALDDTSTVSAAGADAYFQSKGSPFDDHGQFIVAAAQEFRVNPALMIGISNAESSLGKSGGLPIQNKNPGNVKTSTETLLAAGFKQGIDFSGHDGQNHVIFLKWEAGWRGVAEVLRRNYLDEGRDTLEKIAEKYLEGDKERWVKNASDAMSEVCEKQPIDASCAALAGPIQEGKLKISKPNDKEGLPKREIKRMDGQLVRVTAPLCEALADMLNQNLTIPTVNSIVGTHDKLSSSGKVSFHWNGYAMDIDTTYDDPVGRQVMLYFYNNRAGLGVNELFSPWHADDYNIDNCKTGAKNVPGHHNHIHVAFYPCGGGPQ